MALFAVFFLLTACKKDIIAEESWTWADDRWVVSDKKSLTLVASDTTTAYALDLDLRWKADYPFANMYVQTTTVFPSGKEIRSVVSLEMVDADGSWAGQCSGKTCALTYPLQKKFTFPEIGTYTWTIEPYMRVDTVPGVHRLEVTCRKAKG